FGKVPRKVIDWLAHRFARKEADLEATLVRSFDRKLVSDCVRPMRGNVRDFNSGRTDEESAPTRGMTPRRLAAIVIGDIAGYSRLMEFDEEDTHVRVKRIQRDLIEPSIVEHYGRLVKTTGDGFVAIFDSPLESVRCSIVIQQNMLGRNIGLPKDQCIE